MGNVPGMHPPPREDAIFTQPLSPTRTQLCHYLLSLHVHRSSTFSVVLNRRLAACPALSLRLASGPLPLSRCLQKTIKSVMIFVTHEMPSQDVCHMATWPHGPARYVSRWEGEREEHKMIGGQIY